MIEKITEYRKAIAGFIVPALVVLGASLADGVVSAQEWIAVAIAALGTSVAVGVIPNATPGLTATEQEADYSARHALDSESGR